MEILKRLSDRPFFHEIAASLILLLVALLGLALARRAILGSRLPSDVRRRWLVQSRNAAIAGLLVGLVVTWGTEVRSLALSFVAVAAAAVIAAKEVIVCLAGAFVRTSSRAFDLGDRIEIAGVRGDVIDLGALTTTLLEVGPGQSHRTGRAITLPNSLFVTTPVYNETPSGEFLMTTLVVPLGSEADWRACERALLEAAEAECRPFVEEARAHLGASAAHAGLDPSTVDPRVSVRVVDPARTDLLLRLPAPVRQRHRVEQAVLARYLDATRRPPVGGA